ncbi:MAG: ribosome-associated translation inhibitor RaiA [Bdellovibrionota bacterium]|nr:ribosome-associated translation inhibitor RaiA [Deltaproteobacteria bacterium]
MKTEIIFKQMDASDAAKQKVNQKCKKIERYGLTAMECHITLSNERHIQKAEVVVSAKNFRAHGIGNTSDLYASIDQAFQKVDKTIRRYHDRNVRNSRHEQARV